MKVNNNKIFNSIYGLKKIEAVSHAHRDQDSGGSVSVRSKSYADLQAQLDKAREESGFRSKLDPRIAIALTAANSDRVFALKKGDNQANNDIVHDNPLNRGKNTNIEI